MAHIGNKYKLLRQQLDELGYKQVLLPECIPLVEKLLSDFIQTTESLEKYMTIAKNAIEERDTLELGAEPYKCDNAKLVKECNDLHLAFLQYRERSEDTQKGLRKQVLELQNRISDIEKQRDILREKVRDFEFANVISKNKKLVSSKKSVSTSALKDQKCLKSRSSGQLETALNMADKKCANLTKEIKKLKDEQIDYIERCESYKKQITSRDREIERLMSLLEGGRPTQAVSNDCCYRNSEGKLSKLQDEVNILRKEKSNLESCLKESVAKQHEAMKRALHLAERNRELEKELRDIDQMALAVEAEANSSAKTNAEKVNKLQDKIHEALLQIQSMEKEVNELRREKQELLSDWEATKMEKKHLQVLLETTLEEKKLMTDRINQFTIIENDLNLEIDRLMQLSAEQKQKIAEMECKLLSKSLDKEYPPVMLPDKGEKSPRARKTSPPTRRQSAKSKSQKSSVIKPDKKTKNSSSDGNKDTSENEKKGDYCKCCNSKDCAERFKMLLDRDAEQRQLQMCLVNLENLRSEKEYYMKEYHRLLEQNKGAATSRSDSEIELLRKLSEKDQSIHSLQRELNQKMNEKDQLIMNLQKENKILAEEKFNLMSRLETARDRPDTDMEAMSLRSTVKRLEREKELLRADIEKLEDERDSLRRQLKMTSETKVYESARLEKAVRESEEQLRTLEREKRELIQDQGTRRATMDNLKDQVDSLRDQLLTAQSELTHQKSMYNQLKNLHEQCDKTLSEAQSRIRQLENELSQATSRVSSVDRFKGEQERLVSDLREDISVLKKNLVQLEREKDDFLNSLDFKTENIAKLEKELKQKEKYITELEANLTDLKQQFGLMADSTSTKDFKLKTTSAENVNLKKELEAALKAKDNALAENKRIQEELASCIAEGRRVHNDLEIAKRQIEDLKMQLQHYVAEVKRTEDLISQKEVERNELLDQFRSLSTEAALLENSNHTLENEATQSKVQLSVALEHAMDLEKKLGSQETLVQGYEKQIKELTSQVACLEIELKRQQCENQNLEKELSSIRELCGKLDRQKDNISRELEQNESLQSHLHTEVERLRRDSNAMRESLMKDRNNVEQLERLLAESRDEAVNLKIMNQDLQAEMQRLRSKAEDLQNKLRETGEQLDLFQEKALEYSQQNKQLRREIANERFFRSKEDESKRYPSL